MAIITMFIAPLLMYGSDGVFLFTKRFAGFFNIPIVALFVVGIFNKTVSSKAANMTVGLHILLYFSLVWVFKVSLNFQHVMGGLFVFDVISMLLLGKIWEKDTPYEASSDNKSGVDLHEWKHINLLIATVVLSLIALYAFLSPIGLASESGKPLNILIGYLLVELVIIIFFVNKAKKAAINE